MTNAIPQERMPGNHDASYPAPCANPGEKQVTGDLQHRVGEKQPGPEAECGAERPISTDMVAFAMPILVRSIKLMMYATISSGIKWR